MKAATAGVGAGSTPPVAPLVAAPLADPLLAPLALVPETPAPLLVPPVPAAPLADPLLAAPLELAPPALPVPVPVPPLAEAPLVPVPPVVLDEPSVPLPETLSPTELLTDATTPSAGAYNFVSVNVWRAFSTVICALLTVFSALTTVAALGGAALTSLDASVACSASS